MDGLRARSGEVQAWAGVDGRHMMYFGTGGDGVRLLNRSRDVLPCHAACGLLFGAAKVFKDKISFRQPGGGGFKRHQDARVGGTRYAQLHTPPWSPGPQHPGVSLEMA
jgi:hypothetical protein